MRRRLHNHGEEGFREYITSMKIKNFLTEIGVHKDSIVERAGTGVICNIVGTGPEIEGIENKVSSIALLAGMNADDMRAKKGLYPAGK